SYANLLTLFASYDVILIVLNYMLIPRAIALPYVLAVVLEVQYGSKLLTCFHSISFLVSYASLITHFLYRFWIVAKFRQPALFVSKSCFRPFNIAWFSTVKFYAGWLLCVICFCAFLLFITMKITSSEGIIAQQTAFTVYQHKFGGEIRRGWVIFDYIVESRPNISVIFLTLFYMITRGIKFSQVSTMAYFTYRRIATAFALSAQSRSAQLRLLVTACVQGIVSS
ncbi:hypothetical protein PENTCL1PPCAC_5024, partial [Pristionchus entomophagus]